MTKNDFKRRYSNIFDVYYFIPNDEVLDLRDFDINKLEIHSTRTLFIEYLSNLPKNKKTRKEISKMCKETYTKMTYKDIIKRLI